MRRFDDFVSKTPPSHLAQGTPACSLRRGRPVSQCVSERVCVCVRVRVRVRVRACVCVCVCVCVCLGMSQCVNNWIPEREREQSRKVTERKRESVCVCVCVWVFTKSLTPPICELRRVYST